jgi:hypothetical protein
VVTSFKLTNISKVGSAFGFSNRLGPIMLRRVVYLSNHIFSQAFSVFNIVPSASKRLRSHLTAERRCILMIKSLCIKLENERIVWFC